MRASNLTLQSILDILSEQRPHHLSADFSHVQFLRKPEGGAHELCVCYAGSFKAIFFCNSRQVSPTGISASNWSSLSLGGVCLCRRSLNETNGFEKMPFFLEKESGNNIIHIHCLDTPAKFHVMQVKTSTTGDLIKTRLQKARRRKTDWLTMGV